MKVDWITELGGKLIEYFAARDHPMKLNLPYNFSTPLMLLALVCAVACSESKAPSATSVLADKVCQCADLDCFEKLMPGGDAPIGSMSPKPPNPASGPISDEDVAATDRLLACHARLILADDKP
jgi:hypothetical protein